MLSLVFRAVCSAKPKPCKYFSCSRILDLDDQLILPQVVLRTLKLQALLSNGF